MTRGAWLAAVAVIVCCGGDPGRVAVAVAATTAPAAPTAADPIPIPITPAAISALRGVTEARISPDGRAIAYAVSTPGGPTEPAPTRIWLVPVGGSGAAALPVSEAGDHDPRWSPDGRSLAYLGRHGSTGPVTLWLAAAPFGTTRPAASLPGDVSEFRWSPDGKRIAAIVRAEAPTHTDRGATVENGSPGLERLFVVDVAGGAARPVTPPGDFVFDADWAPDGRRLVVRYGAAPGLDYFWYRSRLAVFDLAGHPSSLEPEGVTALHPSFSPDGGSIVFGRFAANGITQEVHRRVLAGGHDVLFGAHWDGSLRNLLWNRDGRALEALGLAGVTPEFVRVDAASGAVTATGPAIGGDPYEFSRADDGTIGMVASTPTRPDEVTLVEGGALRTLTATNPETARWPLGEQRTVTWHSHRDDALLQGILVLPPGRRAGTRLPLFVQVHGGPYDAWTQGWLASWHNWARLLAAHGVAVFMPNPRGSDGRGEAFATAIIGDWGGIDYDDLVDGVVSLERAGIADPAREMIGGWSYGGFMSAWSAGHDTRWRAAIAGAAPTDLATEALTTDVGRSFLQPYFGDPVRDRAGYDAHSPVSFAHGVHIPVLLLHGDADARVPSFQSRLFYTALREGGARVALVRYPHAPHWFGGAVGADTEIDVQDRVLDWVEHNLGLAGGGTASTIP